ncbi:MAG: carbohydrate ABC transporter permease [Defluviitaleaceae bacterium]|nr:carbohydrate ABC transporter permease [Defluviitaleaceae bacterium]
MTTNTKTTSLRIRRSTVGSVVRYVILTAVGIFLAYPLFWMLGSAFKYNADIFGNINILPPVDRWTFANFPIAWQLSRSNTMLFYYINTLRFLIPSIIFTVISCTITAYAVARFNFPGKKIVFTAIIVTLLMPGIAFTIPIFILFTNLGLVNTFAALYIQDIFAVNSFFIFMVIQFLRTVPRELDEASYIDGCSPLQTLWYILAPVLRPVVITVALLSFIWGMNAFQGPLIFLNTPERRVLAVAMRGLMQDEMAVQFGAVFAAATMALLPTLAIFFGCSKFFVESVASSGAKE